VLPRQFFDRPTLTVAAELLGKVIVHRTRAGVAAGMIVEAEAYIGEDDPACHAAPGPTIRNAPLYGPPGIAYVYLNYGIHYLVNAVTESEGSPAAVLIRALEPIEGVPLMMRRRGKGGRESFFTKRKMTPDPITNLPITNLCRGPGNLTVALGISLAENRLDLTSSRLSIEDRGHRPSRIAWGPRIGIRHATDRPWRCWIDGHPCVSGPQSRARARATMS
jgi:DNA-3-methyladenine glycosylase